MRFAVIGGGISGLGAAFELAKAGVEVVLYEKEELLGGHAQIVNVNGIDVDLNFMVFNRVFFFVILLSFCLTSMDEYIM